MFTLLSVLLTLNSALAEDICQKNKVALERKATQSFLTAIKSAAVQEINNHYQKNNLGPVKYVDLIGHSPEVLNFKVEAGKDSVNLMVKIKEKIKVAVWPKDNDKKDVDALGRTKTPGTKCIAHAYTFATTKDKLFLDIQNSQTKAVIASFSVKNLVVEEMSFK